MPCRIGFLLHDGRREQSGRIDILPTAQWKKRKKPKKERERKGEWEEREWEDREWRAWWPLKFGREVDWEYMSSHRGDAKQHVLPWDGGERDEWERKGVRKKKREGERDLIPMNVPGNSWTGHMGEYPTHHAKPSSQNITNNSLSLSLFLPLSLSLSLSPPPPLSLSLSCIGSDLCVLW
jgi:hypothetical protein